MSSGDTKALNELVTRGDTAALLTKTQDPLQFARLLATRDDLSAFPPNELLAIRDMLPVRFINIGGGPTFCYPLWANLDTATGPLNPTPFRLSAEMTFPHETGSINLVYSSHNFEHLDDLTVERALREARRVLHPGGAIVVKIPDFQRFLMAWRTDDHDYLSTERWGFDALVLESRGLRDSLTVRTSYGFCGFWNDAYGDLFSARRPDAVGAYNGPAAIQDKEAEVILRGNSAHAIAATLRALVVENEVDYTFNHQNAWDRQEFSALLGRCGFDLLSDDAEKIQRHYSYIPRVSQMSDISAYFIAVAA